MLTEQMKELLTAFVDGELSQRQRKAVLRLLHKSSEARELVRQLKENAHKIKQLPRHKCEPSLVDDVLAAIGDTQPATPRPTRRRWLPYIAAALAASVMIGAAGVAFWAAQNLDLNQKSAPVAEIKPEPKIEKKPKTPEPPPIKPTNPLLAKLIDGAVSGAAAPVIEGGPFVASFKELRSDEKSHLLRRELEQDKVVQLDISVSNNTLAMDHLRTILKARGIKVIADDSAKKAKVEYLVYADNFTPDEVTNLMGELAQKMTVSGPKGNNQKEVDSPYKQVTAAPADKQKLAKLLGIDATAIEPKNAKAETKRERSVVLLPGSTAAPPAEVRQFATQRRPQPGTVQVLIKIRQD